MTEYEVIWNGAHQGQNRDLLVPLDVPVPTRTYRPGELAPTPWRDPERLNAIYAAVLACLEQRPCRRVEIRSITGFSEAAIGVAMKRLQREGRLTSQGFGVWALR